MRVTDLEKFSLEQIWRPYWPSYDRGDLPRPIDVHGALERLSRPPMDLTGTATALVTDDAWSRKVIGRLANCRVEFPDYVWHLLVDVVRSKIAQMSQTEEVSR